MIFIHIYKKIYKIKFIEKYKNIQIKYLLGYCIFSNYEVTKTDYNKIIKKIMLLNPEIKIITVHDSLVFPKKYRDIVQSIFDYELSAELI